MKLENLSEPTPYFYLNLYQKSLAIAYKITIDCDGKYKLLVSMITAI